MTEKRKPGRPQGPPTKPLALRFPLDKLEKIKEKGGTKWLYRIIEEKMAEA